MKAAIAIVIGLALLGSLLNHHHGSHTAAAVTKPPPTARSEANGYIRRHSLAIYRVSAYLASVQDASAVLNASRTAEHVDALARAAQNAHDAIAAVRADFADTAHSSTVNNAELRVFTGANELKNAMGAVVAFAGSPNAATLAHFGSQFVTARTDWNAGIRRLWTLAGRAHPPTI